MHTQMRLVFFGVQHVHIEHLLDHMARFIHHIFERDLTRFHAREIQYVVHQGEQGIPGVVEDRHITPLLRRQRRIAQQLGHPHNRVQRCPELVAHAGKEFRLDL